MVRCAVMARGVLVNDVHSRLNATRVREVVRVSSVDAVVETVRAARRRGLRLCVAGGRHAMGGQAFAEGAVLVDTRGLDRIGRLDPAARTVEVEAGMEWPGLVAGLARMQEGAAGPLTIEEAGGIATSFPGFAATLTELGGDLVDSLMVSRP